MKFVTMKKPLQHAVYNGTKVAIPEGAKGVKIAFRQSHLSFKNAETGEVQKMNVYLWKGKCYHQ